MSTSIYLRCHYVFTCAGLGVITSVVISQLACAGLGVITSATHILLLCLFMVAHAYFIIGYAPPI